MDCHLTSPVASLACVPPRWLDWTNKKLLNLANFLARSLTYSCIWSIFILCSLSRALRSLSVLLNLTVSSLISDSNFRCSCCSVSSWMQSFSCCACCSSCVLLSASTWWQWQWQCRGRLLEDYLHESISSLSALFSSFRAMLSSSSVNISCSGSCSL